MISLPETLSLGAIIGTLPPILIFGIQPGSIEPGDELTQKLSVRFKEYVEQVYNTILDFNQEAVN